MEKVMRKLIADYLNVAESGSTEEWAFMGKGFKALDESPSPNVEKEAFICDSVASASVDRYEPSFAFDSYLIKDEKAIISLHKVGRNQLTGSEAERDYIRVDVYDPATAGSTTEFKARKFKVAVEVSDCSGEGAKAMTVKGNLNQVGDLILGTFNTSTKEFTAEGAASEPSGV